MESGSSTRLVEVAPSTGTTSDRVIVQNGVVITHHLCLSCGHLSVQFPSLNPMTIGQVSRYTDL